MENEMISTPVASEQTDLLSVAGTGEMARVQAQVVSAKRFPRDNFAAYEKIISSCKRKSLAEQALYAYPRGGKTVTGPSIRLAEVLAQCWGNIDTGVRELVSADGESVVEAYAYDLETNFRDSKLFRVLHVRDTKEGGKTLTDSRDVYEMVMNMAQRRKRACILAVIPSDVVESAVEQVRETLAGDSSAPIEDKIRSMISSFKELDVPKKLIEQRLDHSVDLISRDELLELRTIYSSLKDGMSKREDWFKVPKSKTDEDMNDKLKARRGRPKKQEPTPLMQVEANGKTVSNLSGKELAIEQLKAQEPGDLVGFYSRSEVHWLNDLGPEAMAEIDDVYMSLREDAERPTEAA